MIVQAHNGDPVSFLRENQDADVVKALSTLDAEIGGADTFGRCAVSVLKIREEVGVIENTNNLHNLSSSGA